MFGSTIHSVSSSQQKNPQTHAVGTKALATTPEKGSPLTTRVDGDNLRGTVTSEAPGEGSRGVPQTPTPLVPSDYLLTQ